MTSNDVLTSASVQPSTLIVGDYTSYTFTVVSPVDMISGDNLYIEVPSGFSSSIKNTFSSCSGSTGLSGSLSCNMVGENAIMVKLSFSSSPYPANNAFRVIVKNI